MTAVIAVFIFTQKQNQFEISAQIPFDSEIFRSGARIFRQGRGIFSEFFRNVGELNSPYSHVGIIYMENNNVFVIHTEANEVTGLGFAKKDELTNFISKTNAFSSGLYRIKNLGSKDAESVMKTALGYVRNKIPFDTDFDLNSSCSLYCTELVDMAYKSVGINLVEHPYIIQFPIINRLLNREVITVGQLVESNAIEFVSKLK